MPDNLTTEDQELLGALGEKYGFENEDEPEGLPGLTDGDRILHKPGTDQFGIDDLRTVLDSIGDDLVEGMARTKKYSQWRKRYQADIAKRAKAERERIAKLAEPGGGLGWPHGLGHAEALKKVGRLEDVSKKLVAAQLPKDPVDELITNFVEEIDARGFAPGYKEALTPEVRRELKEQIASATSSYFDRAHILQLTGNMEKHDPETAAKIRADTILGISADVILRNIPLSAEQYMASSSLAIRTAAKRRKEEIAQFGTPEAALQRGHEAAAGQMGLDLDALNAFLEMDSQQAAELRRDVAHRMFGRDPGAVAKARAYDESPFSEAGVFFPTGRSTRHETVSRLGRMAEQVWGRDWADVLAQAFQNTDSALVLSSLGVINDGYDAKTGTLSIDPLSPSGFSPMFYVEHRKTPDLIAAERKRQGLMAGRRFRNYDNTLGALNQFKRETGIGGEKADVS